MPQKHQVQPTTTPVTSDALRRQQLALEAQITAAGAAGVTTFNARSGAVSLTTGDVNSAIALPSDATKYYNGLGAWTTPAGGGGGVGYSVVTKIAGYTETATSGDLIIKANLTAGFTIVLPTAVGNTAKITIKKIQAAGQIIIDGNGAQTIDGGLTATLNNLDEAITLFSDGANWGII